MKLVLDTNVLLSAVLVPDRMRVREVSVPLRVAATPLPILSRPVPEEAMAPPPRPMVNARLEVSPVPT